MQDIPISDIVNFLDTDLKDVMAVLSRKDVFEVMLNPVPLLNGEYEGHLWYEAAGVGMKQLIQESRTSFNGNYPVPKKGDLVVVKTINDGETLINYQILPKTQEFFKALKVCLCYSLGTDSDNNSFLEQEENFRLNEFGNYIQKGLYTYKEPIASATTIDEIIDKINDNYLYRLNMTFRLSVFEVVDELDFPVPQYSIAKEFLKVDYIRAEQIIGILASANEKKAHKYEPIVEVQIPYYGHRFTGILPPVSKFPMFAIRKHSSQVKKIEEYVNEGIMPAEAADIICKWIHRRYNLLIGGAVSSGKTTLLNTCLDLSNIYTPNDRVGVLEDTPEVNNTIANSYALATADGVNFSRLLRTSLRLSSHRLVAGELRGPEAYILLKAMSGGFRGCMGTIHADGAAHALNRFEQCLSENEEVGKVTPAHRIQIASSIQGIISIQKVTIPYEKNGVRDAAVKRRVTALRYIKSYDPRYDLYEDQWLYKDPESFMLTMDGPAVDNADDFAEYQTKPQGDIN